MSLSDEEKGRWALISQFSLFHGGPVFFGLPPDKSQSPKISNGTMTFIDLGQGPIGITCSHVIQGYREKFRDDSGIIFQIGQDLRFNPLEYLISDNPRLDLATFDLRGGRLAKALSTEPPGNLCWRPKFWPPRMVAEGDVIMSLGGFPGVLRMAISWDEIMFAAVTHGMSPVTSATDEYFVCRFEHESWINVSGAPESSLEFNDFGGMSGGPVFIARESYLEFVGVISRYGPTLDLLHVALARFVNPDGTITEN